MFGEEVGSYKGGESTEEAGIEDELSLSVSAEADQVVSKQKIRIKLRSFYVRLIEDSCKQIMEAARTTNAKTMGPVPLPTKRKIYCVPPTCTRMQDTSLRSDPTNA